MLKLTYDEYDEMCARMEEVYEKYPTKPYFPSEEEIMIMAGNIDKYYDFIVYLASTNPIPATPDEVSSMKLLNKVIGSNTEFTE